MPRVRDMLPPSSITPTSGVWDSMDAGTQQVLVEIAANVKLLLWRVKADDAYDEMKSHKLTADEHVALWTRFDSNERRVLSAVGQARREKEQS